MTTAQNAGDGAWRATMVTTTMHVDDARLLASGDTRQQGWPTMAVREGIKAAVAGVERGWQLELLATYERDHGAVLTARAGYAGMLQLGYAERKRTQWRSMAHPHTLASEINLGLWTLGKTDAPAGQLHHYLDWGPLPETLQPSPQVRPGAEPLCMSVTEQATDWTPEPELGAEIAALLTGAYEYGRMRNGTRMVLETKWQAEFGRGNRPRPQPPQRLTPPADTNRPKAKSKQPQTIERTGTSGLTRRYVPEPNEPGNDRNGTRPIDPVPAWLVVTVETMRSEVDHHARNRRQGWNWRATVELNAVTAADRSPRRAEAELHELADRVVAGEHRPRVPDPGHQTHTGRQIIAACRRAERQWAATP